MANNVGYASELRYGDVLPLLLQACSALVLKLGAVERFLSNSGSLCLGAYPTNRPMEAPTTPMLGHESVQAPRDETEMYGNQDFGKDRESTALKRPTWTQDALENKWAPH